MHDFNENFQQMYAVQFRVFANQFDHKRISQLTLSKIGF